MGRRHERVQPAVLYCELRAGVPTSRALRVAATLGCPQKRRARVPVSTVERASRSLARASHMLSPTRSAARTSWNTVLGLAGLVQRVSGACRAAWQTMMRADPRVCGMGFVLQMPQPTEDASLCRKRPLPAHREQQAHKLLSVARVGHACVARQPGHRWRCGW